MYRYNEVYFLDPMKFFKKFILSKYRHWDALSSIGSPDEPLYFLSICIQKILPNS